MLVLILSLVSLGVILLVTTYFHRKNKTDSNEPEIFIEPAGECCGAHAICEKDTLLSSNNKIIYYDDEELDVLVDLSPSDFTNEQIKQLSDVFYTMKESDVAGWLRSLQMRHIQLPVELREQALLIVSERRIEK